MFEVGQVGQNNRGESFVSLFRVAGRFSGLAEEAPVYGARDSQVIRSFGRASSQASARSRSRLSQSDSGGEAGIGATRCSGGSGRPLGP